MVGRLLDPLGRARQVSRFACRGVYRKYYRFRATRFYGGSATADCVGCNLECFYCWSGRVRDRPWLGYLGFFSPEEVASRLLSIADRHGFRIVRVSGNEPLLCRRHLFEVLKRLEAGMDGRVFVLETNGTLLDSRTVGMLRSFREFLHVRVSLKGACEAEFREVTGCRGFSLQIKALENLYKAGISCSAAIMVELTTFESLRRVKEIVKRVNPDAWVELESYVPYGNVDYGGRLREVARLCLRN